MSNVLPRIFGAAVILIVCSRGNGRKALPPSAGPVVELAVPEDGHNHNMLSATTARPGPALPAPAGCSF